jgi:drug/metabolite transporter (DMT)-like permease
VWAFLAEQPGITTLLGGAVVLGAVAVQSLSGGEPAVPPP